MTGIVYLSLWGSSRCVVSIKELNVCSVCFCYKAFVVHFMFKKVVYETIVSFIIYDTLTSFDFFQMSQSAATQKTLMTKTQISQKTQPLVRHVTQETEKEVTRGYFR